MKDITKRFLLFLFGCMGFRLFLTITAKNIEIDYLPDIGYITLIFAIGMAYFYISETRKTGVEVFGDKIWWDKLRPVHILFYLMFSFSAFNKNPDSWYYLLVDTIYGLSMFIYFHYSNNNFSKIFS